MTNNKFDAISQYAGLISVIFVLFLFINNLWSWADWGAIGYAGDSHQVMAIVKAFSSGEAVPFGEKIIENLGAPFGANWFDFPFEDALWIIPGVLASWLGVPHALMMYLLFLAIAAGVAFYFVGHQLGYRSELIFVCAILFAFSPYFYYRSFGHMNLTAYWHIPLLLYVLYDFSNRGGKIEGILIARRVFFVSAILAGLFSVYYLYPFLFVLGLLILGYIILKRYNEAKNLALIFVTASCVFIFQHLSTLWFQAIKGPNPGALVRDFNGLSRWGLRLDDLVFPFQHRVDVIQRFSNDFHLSRVPDFFRGEAQFAYIGIVAVVSLGWLLIRDSSLMLVNDKGAKSRWYPIALLIILLGIVGGFNYLFGNFGLIIFRATNRFSIFLITIALFFLCECVSKSKISRSISVVAAVIILVIGLFDQIPAGNRSRQWLDQTKKEIESDRQFAAEIEKKLPVGAMVFQLPVVPYPEAGVRIHMNDYEHFRPYFFTKKIRYSYGTIKGRGDAEWQESVARLPVSEMVDVVESYGFHALLINRKGFDDAGKSLIDTLINNKIEIVADSPDMIMFRLKASVIPVADIKGLMNARILHDGIDFTRRDWPEFLRGATGLSGPEPWGRWSDANVAPVVRFEFFSALPKKFTLVLSAQPFGPNTDRDFVMRVGSQEHRLRLKEGGSEVRVPIELADESVYVVEFAPPQPTSPQQLGSGADTRKLGIGFVRLRFDE